MYFDIIAKFETKVMVKFLDRDFEDLLNACSYGNIGLPHSIHTLEHTINITNSPVIPNEECKGEGGTSLGIETERLNLVVECFSEEPGCGFEEHYVFVKGKLIVDEVMEDYREYDTTRFETVEEMNEHYETSFTKEEFERDFYLYTGGFKEWKYDTWKK